jgi:hypothetical protein
MRCNGRENDGSDGKLPLRIAAAARGDPYRTRLVPAATSLTMGGVVLAQRLWRCGGSGGLAPPLTRGTSRDVLSHPHVRAGFAASACSKEGLKRRPQGTRTGYKDGGKRHSGGLESAGDRTYLTAHWPAAAGLVRGRCRRCQGLHNTAFLPYWDCGIRSDRPPRSINGRNGLVFWIVSPCREDECKDC